MLNKMSITWNCKQVVNMMKKGKCSFDNIIQRSYVWEKARKSDLIHSMIEGYPVPPFYTRRIAGVYDFLDGKQRMDAISGFINDEYELTNLPMVSYEPMDANESIELDISSMKFSELPEELQDVILGYSLTIYYYEDITTEQIATMFRKLNNGKPLSTKERNIASCTDIEKVTEIGEHNLFKTIITAKGLTNRKQIPLVMKIWCMLNQEEVSFESKNFNKVMEETIISKEQNEEIRKVLDALEEVYILIGEKKEKAEARMLRRKFASETHLISFVPFVKKALEEEMAIEVLTDFFCHFYGNANDASISDEYNATAKGGSAKAVNISRRNDELQAAWDEFFKEDDESACMANEEEDVAEVVKSEDDADGEFENDANEEFGSFTDGIIADMENHEE